MHESPEDPSVVPGGFLTDINPNSLTVNSNALADQSLTEAKSLEQFQFERIGFFSVDTESSSKKLIFNRTVNLKEDKGKA